MVSCSSQAVTRQQQSDFNCQFKLKDSVNQKKVHGAAGHPGYHALEHVALEPEQD